MNDYKVGQIIVVKEDFLLNEGQDDDISVNHLKGEYHQITEFNKLSSYPINTILVNEVKSGSDIKLGERCLFTMLEIEKNFITYEAWIALHREEQIKSILDEF